MEARIARLESDVAHLRTDVADIKTDVRSLRDKLDVLGAKLLEKIEKLAKKSAEKFEIARLDARTANLESSIASAKIWVLLFLIGYGTAILGAMARGFDWL